MSIPYQVKANSRLYTVVDDCITTYSVVIDGTVTDEILGEFQGAGFAVDVTRDDLNTVTTENGLYAVSGYPEQSFPQLNLISYPLKLVLTAPGFRDETLPVVVPQNAVFPVSVPNVAMRRLPVRIQGCVVNETTRAPINGALILSVDDPLSLPGSHTIALRSPLYFDHANGIAIQQVNLTPVGGAPLTEDARAGTSMLNLAARTGLGPNSIVQLANAPRSLVEYAIVDHLGPGAASAPGEVYLRNALNRSYATGVATTVQFVTAAPMGAPASLTMDADVGDGVLIASQLLNGSTLVVDPASPNQVEYHEVGAITGSEGYYAFSGMGRVRELFLRASQGASNKIVEWFVEYDRPINVVDFRL